MSQTAQQNVVRAAERSFIRRSAAESTQHRLSRHRRRRRRAKTHEEPPEGHPAASLAAPNGARPTGSLVVAVGRPEEEEGAEGREVEEGAEREELVVVAEGAAPTCTRGTGTFPAQRRPGSRTAAAAGGAPGTAALRT